MNNARFAILVGLILGGIWAFTGFTGAALAAVLATVGLLIALVLDGRLDVTEFLGHRHDE